MPAPATASPGSRRTCCRRRARARSPTGCSASSPRAHAARTRALLLSDPAAQHVGGDGRRAAARRRGRRGRPRAADRARRARAAGERDGRARASTRPRCSATRRRRAAQRRWDVAAARGATTRRAATRRLAPPPARPTTPPRPAGPRGSAARSSSARRSCSWRPCSSSSSRAATTTAEPTADAPVATATATATATRVGQRHRPARARRARRRSGLMRLFQANDDTVRFAIAAPGRGAQQGRRDVLVWFRKDDGAAQLLGDVKDPVAEKGELTSAGPEQRRRRQVPAVVRRVRLDPRHARRARARRSRARSSSAVTSRTPAG